MSPLRASTVLLAIIAAAGCSAAAGKKGEGQKGPPPAPVTVATAVAKDVPLELRAIGAIQPSSTVAVRSQITGLLTEAHLAEGGEVAKDQLLFTIDPRPQAQALAQAQANLEKSRSAEVQAEATLARDQAQAENAERQSKRYADLLAQGITTQEQVEQLRTAADAARATIDADRAAVTTAKAAIVADRAAVETAQVQLGYSAIHAPSEGRVGLLGVNVGNLVAANDTVLVTINRIRPIYAAFSLPESALADLRQRRTQGAVAVAVAVTPASGGRREEGTLEVIDNQVAQATGTIALRATFANADESLWPGQFVDVTVTLGVDHDAVTVPSQAVQTGQQGDYAYVVKADRTAEVRPITVARIVGADAVIAKGLAVGEQVVIDGMVRVAPGAKLQLGDADGGAKPGGEGVARDGDRKRGGAGAAQ